LKWNEYFYYDETSPTGLDGTEMFLLVEQVKVELLQKAILLVALRKTKMEHLNVLT